MKKVHLVLQGKGGVGKSLVCALMAMAYEAKYGVFPTCIDTDPVNPTFAGYKAFNAELLTLLEENQINERNFDQIVEIIVNSKEDVIIDTGASSFLPFLSYLISNGVFDILKSLDIEPLISTIVAGGPEMVETINSLYDIIDQCPEDVGIITWLNPHHGELIVNKKTFEQTPFYEKTKHRYQALITLPKLRKDTHLYDFANMITNRQTFDEAIASSDINIMGKARLKQVKENIFGSINLAEFLNKTPSPKAKESTKK